jgi:transcriptional regulator with XRE-family HTH domain
MDTSVGSRLREERERMGLTQAAMGEMLGMAKHSILNYESDKRSPDALFMTAIANAGADVLYVLTGKRQQTSPPLPAAMNQVLMERGILTGQGPRADQAWISATGLMWLLHLHAVRRNTRNTAPLPWGRGLLQELVELDGESMRAIHVQAIQLKGYETQAYWQLLAYEVRSPVHTPWSLQPASTLHKRFALDVIGWDLPINFRAEGAQSLQPMLVLQDDEHAALLRGDVLTVSPAGVTHTTTPAHTAQGTTPPSPSGPQINADKIGTVSTGKIGKIVQNL